MKTPAPIDINKTFEIIVENKKFLIKLSIKDKNLNIELSKGELIPGKYFYINLTKENLENLCILFKDKETDINDCFNIISDLINNKKINIEEKEINKKFNIIFSPKIYMIKDFKIELKENNLNQNEINDLLYNKINELEQIIKNLQNNVLLISKEKESLLNKLLIQNPCINKISVIEPSMILPNLTEKILSKFKIVIYDICNGGFGKTNNKEEVKNYLLKGGNIIVTHDHWTYLLNCDFSELLGAKLVTQSYQGTTKAKIIKKDHPVFKSFYDLYSENTNNYITIGSTHKTDTDFSDKLEEFVKDLVIQLEDGKNGEYLLIKEYGKGKIIFWNVERPSITEFEKKLFINFLSWICE